MVKFQKRSIDIVYTEEFLKRKKSPWGGYPKSSKRGFRIFSDDFDIINNFL